MENQDSLREFIVGLCSDIVIYDSKYSSPFKDGDDYIKFGQNGIVKQGIEDPLQDEFDPQKFKDALIEYTAGKTRLILREWPAIRLSNNKQHGIDRKYSIRVALVGDDGTNELLTT